MSKRIGLIYTGGTFGMVDSAEGLAPASESSAPAISMRGRRNRRSPNRDERAIAAATGAEGSAHVTKPVEVMLTTTPGLEDVVAAELRERAQGAGIAESALTWPTSPVAGRVRVDMVCEEAEAKAVALSLRSIHHAMRHVETAQLPDEAPLSAIDERIRALDWPELNAATPFRVTSARHGVTGFSSPDLQTAAGAALQAATSAPVDLRGYRFDIVVDAIYTHYTIGVRWSDRPLGLRYARRFNQRVALKPPVAYALLRLGAGDTAPARVLDPFCGTGTILLEAAATIPGVELAGADINATCIEGTRSNLEAAGYSHRAELKRLDARELGCDCPRAPVDLIATNPPYGRRLGRGIRFSGFYAQLLDAAARVVVPGGRLAILVGKRGAFNAALTQASGWHIRHVRVIDMNHVRAGLFVVAYEPAGEEGVG